MVDQAREGAASFMSFIASDPDWERLFFDFSFYAMRNQAFRAELVTRRRALREGIATLLQRRVDELGVDAARARGGHRDDGLRHGRRGRAPASCWTRSRWTQELYPTMLATFFAGLRAAADGA